MGGENMNPDIPLCQADAVRKVRQVPINGVPTGINMLDGIIDEVRKMNLSSEQQIRDAILVKVRGYNYIPKPAEEAYAKAILGEYHRSDSG